MNQELRLTMEVNILVTAVGILSAAGALSAFLGWNRSTEPFDARKFISGVATGVIAGIALVLANAAGIMNAVDQTAQWILIGSLALSIIGADTVRTALTGAIKKEEEEDF
jgi:hypothetical protein